MCFTSKDVLVGGLEQLRWPKSPASGAAALTERGLVRFLVAMVVFPHTFAEHVPGDKMNVVCKLQIWDGVHEKHLFQSVNDKVLFYAEGLIDGSCECYTFMQATLRQHYPVPMLILGEDSKIFRHEPPSWESLFAVAELCAGFGGMTQGLSASGFHTVTAVDFNDRMCHLFRKQHDIDTITGDVCDVETVCKVWHQAKGVGTLAAGFACQPFSHLGDQKGGQDRRALSLRGVLEMAFYLQVQVVILECVSAAAANQFVKDEIQRFVDVSGFLVSQTELHLEDVWVSRRSRAWWILSAPFLGKIPLVPWPKSNVVSKVLHVISGILPWDANDERLLALKPEEVIAFEVGTEKGVRYLLNFEGCAPCALHAWGSQVLACECGCRSSGLSPFRLQEKGLFGLLVYVATSDGSRILRHLHPCECNALNGFDPVVDFGDNPRLTLSASGQMASPFQAAWVFATVAERIHQLKQTSKVFTPSAVLQALQSWTLMRCRQVWPCEHEPLSDEKMISLVGFWSGFEKWSIHELMHPPKWPNLTSQQLCLASVLDAIIRDQQTRNAPVQAAPKPEDVVQMDIDAEPTPWIEQHVPSLISEVSPDECVIVFTHEMCAPVKFVCHSPCTIQEVVDAQIKLVGEFHILHVCNEHGIELPLSHVLEMGNGACIQCVDSPFITPTILDENPGADGGHDCDDAPMESCTGEVKCDAAVEVSPTAPWTHPIQEGMPDAVGACRPYDENECVLTPGQGGLSGSLLSAAPLMYLQAENFLQLQIPVVMQVKHLWALRQQLLRPTDRGIILQHQQGLWADDEFRYHLHLLADMHVQSQQRMNQTKVKKCTVLDPLLMTGWLHHGVAECAQWGASHPEVLRDGHSVITCCVIDGHWLPLIMSPVAGVLNVSTWDAPSNDHKNLGHTAEVIGHALGFQQVLMIRHHRMFLTSDMCGALAMAFLNHELLNIMLPTSQAEVQVVHTKLRGAFVAALQNSQMAHRPWVWGAGDVQGDGANPNALLACGSNEVPGASSVHVDPATISNSHQCMPKEARLDLIRSKAKMLGDDEIRFHMLRLMRQREYMPYNAHAPKPGFVMMDPLLLSTWDSIGKGLCEAWCRTNRPLISEGFQIVAIFYHEEHWFPLWFTHQRSTIVAHRFDDWRVSSELVMPLLNTLQESLGFEAKVEHVIPDALPAHQFCGVAAVAFLSHLLMGDPLPKTVADLEDLHAELRSEFVEALFLGTCCICPVVWGAGPFGAVVHDLAEELQKHGVPAHKAELRAQQAVKAIGSDNVTQALKSKHAWRSLKALGSNVRFQFILPDELEKVVQANKGQPVGKKPSPGMPKSKPEPPAMLDPTKLALVDGTFRVQGSPVSQIAVQQIGPVACGVALITHDEALPYLKAGKTVSAEPLALAILAPPGLDVVTSLPATKVMIPCMCLANREPLLVEAVLVQLGQGFIEKHVATSAISLDQLEVATIKAMVYQDEFAGQWNDFISSPIKHLVRLFPVLRRCTEVNCSCECWHNPDELAVRDPIMDVWRRQFLNASFKPVAASKATIFSVCLRLPVAILPVMLAQSGHSGVYMEPRTPDGREVMPAYSVIWTPKMSSTELAHLKQTNPAIIGFARLGERKGIRVLASQAQSMHDLVKPDAPFLPSGPKTQFVAGPFPWGSDRQAITKAMKQAGWCVKALQPMQPVPNRGSMWLLQSVDAPPESIIQTTHGEVVISKHKEHVGPAKQTTMSTVGSVSTLSLCGSVASGVSSESDPWLASDPWGSYSKTTGPKSVAPANQGLQQLEERIQTAVLAKMPAAMDQEMPERLSTLEGQVQMLMTKHHSLEAQVHEFSASSTQQFAVVQQQIQQQSQAFHGQFESHAQGIQAMFTQQMEQIRGLLSKRPREDNME